MAGSDSAREAREKQHVTLISVAAAIVLTALKLIVGLLTGSLGMLSEAAHSGLDTVASVITFFSVRIAGRPPDVEHPYGHGRFENLSATIQGILLIATAAAIIYESVRRIFFTSVTVETSVWTFVVMLASIGVDFWRSRMLTAAAKRFDSPAMEADALNFRADMFSASVVILGLGLTAYAEHTGRSGWLLKGDALAALVVGLVIVAMSVRLAVQAVNVLLDRVPAEVRERLTRAAEVPGVVEARPVRVRESGNRLFADVVVTVPRTTSLAEAHQVSEEVEAALRAVEPRTETVVHVEPAIPATESAADRIHAIAQRLGARTHHEQIYRVGDHLEASLHLEVPPQLTLGEAHALAHRLGYALREDDPALQRIDTHIEVAVPEPGRRQEMTAAHPDLVAAIADAVRGADLGADCHEIRLYRSDVPGWDAALHCDFPAQMPMGEIHHRTELIEQAVRERVPDMDHVVIHAEPAEGS